VDRRHLDPGGQVQADGQQSARAAGMSVNALLTSLDPGLAGVEQVGVNFARAKGIAADDPHALEKLRALPADQVVDGMNLANRAPQDPSTYFGPFADGKVAVDAGAAFAAGRFARVPVMSGATSADIGGKTGFMVAGARSLARRLAAQGVPVYAYRFSYVADSIGQPGAQHASDIPYFFATVDVKYGAAATKKDVAMGRAMSAYLVNFAKKGDPNGRALPAWPRYAGDQDVIMDFAASGKPVAGRDPWGPEIDATTVAHAQ
jgi:para-nitrobenzyl esterase